MEIKEQGKKIGKRLVNNLGLKLASLLLAFVLWFLVVQINDPTDEKTFRNIKVQLINTELLEKENKVYEVLDATDVVRVTVTAPGSVLDQMSASDIVAQADVSKITDINTIAIDVDTPNVEVAEIKSSPDILRLNVEDRSAKWMDLTPNITGKVADGYMLGNITLTPSRFNVSGPKSVIDQISSAVVELDVSGVSNKLSANVPIQMYDAEGNLLDQASLTKNVTNVSVSVEVLAVKEVPVSVNYTGTPADGYLTTGVVECSPATVKIAGSSSAVSAVSQITIPEDRLNITGETGDMTEIVNLKEYLPENVRLADSSFNGRATVTIYIEPEAEKVLNIPLRNIVIQNLPEGYQAQLPENVNSYELKVSGLSDLIQPLSSITLRGTIDIAAWMERRGMQELTAGVYQIPVSFGLAEEITKSEVTAEVTISLTEE